MSTTGSQSKSKSQPAGNNDKRPTTTIKPQQSEGQDNKRAKTETAEESKNDTSNNDVNADDAFALELNRKIDFIVGTFEKSRYGEIFTELSFQNICDLDFYKRQNPTIAKDLDNKPPYEIPPELKTMLLKSFELTFGEDDDLFGIFWFPAHNRCSWYYHKGNFDDLDVDENMVANYGWECIGFVNQASSAIFVNLDPSSEYYGWTRYQSESPKKDDDNDESEKYDNEDFITKGSFLLFIDHFYYFCEDYQKLKARNLRGDNYSAAIKELFLSFLHPKPQSLYILK